jgi:hypothetical protein
VPNWCSNSLWVTGEATELDDFVAKAEGHPPTYKPSRAELERSDRPTADDAPPAAPPSPTTLNFHSLLPVPGHLLQRTYGGEDEAADEQSSGGGVDPAGAGAGADRCGYDWEWTNWGVKWGAVGTRRDRINDTEVRYSFDTAWSPPLQFFVAVSPQFPRLRFELRATIEHEEYEHWVIQGGRADLLERRMENFQTGEVVIWHREPREPGAPVVTLFCLAHLWDSESGISSDAAGEGAGVVPLGPASLFGEGPVEALLFSNRDAPPPPADAGDEAELRAVYRYVGHMPADELASWLQEDARWRVDFRGRLELLQDGRLGAAGDVGGTISRVRQIGFAAYERVVRESAVAGQMTMFELVRLTPAR